MNSVSDVHDKLIKDANLAKSIDDIQSCIDRLTKARDNIIAGTTWFSNSVCVASAVLSLILVDTEPKSASVTLAKLQNGIKEPFEEANKDLLVVYNGHLKYSKMLDKVSSLC